MLVNINRVFIKYCVFSDVLNILDSGLSLFYLIVIVCTHTRQLENQRCRQNWQSSEKSQNYKEKRNI